MRASEMQKAPEGFATWPAYWYERVRQGTPLLDLTSSRYAVADVRHFARQYALKNGLPLPKALEYIRPPQAGRGSR